ncbi:uncharacterized protein LOC142334609 isoform X2 [Convolutriloba macropyga]|uniref:uncharacterized protein LOC142334609 isoform X2 n=1 Tax=Convolutriloba macropyga TaxID=536237 RepID=UPI003F527C61
MAAATQNSEASRIEKLEHFLNRELRGSTLANYTIKADIRAHRRAEKVNKMDVQHTRTFDRQIQNEFNLARMNIENAQMRYARKLHSLKLAQMKFHQETESRVNTAPGLPRSRRTWTAVSSKRNIGNAELRSIIRASTSHHSAAQPDNEKETKERAKTAGAADDENTEGKQYNAQDMFIARLSSLLRPAEKQMEWRGMRRRENASGDGVKSAPPKSRSRSTIRLPKISLDGGKAAREFQRYPDAPEEMLSMRDHLLLNSEKEDTMYTWLGFENQDQLDRRRGLAKFKMVAKKVTLRDISET